MVQTDYLGALAFLPSPPGMSDSVSLFWYDLGWLSFWGGCFSLRNMIFFFLAIFVEQLSLLKGEKKKPSIKE